MYRLIIADDEENIRNGMAHSLPWREWGYEVVALCASGQEVLNQAERGGPGGPLQQRGRDRPPMTSGPTSKPSSRRSGTGRG